MSRQRPASAGWCGTPPCSVSLAVAEAADCKEDEALAAAAAVRARFAHCVKVASASHPCERHRREIMRRVDGP